MDRPLVCFDSESATAYGPPHLIEIGAVRVVDGEIESEFSTLCRPEVPIEPATTEIHGLDDADVADAPPTAAALAALFDWLRDDWLVAHDAPQDARALAFESARAGLAPPSAPWIDTLALTRKLLPDAPDHRLETLCEHLDLEDGPRHRALADAVWVWKVLEACLERDDAPATGTELLARSGRRVTVSGEWPEPRLKPRLRRLKSASVEGTGVTLVYGDPDDEPVPLDVVPRLVYRLGGHDYLEGECAKSGLLKTYRLDRIHKVLAR